MDLKEVTRVDLACGNNKRQGFFGIDIDSYPNVDHVMDLRFNRLPFEDNQLNHVLSSHFCEHLTFEENIYLFNEVYRVLKPGAIFEVIVPHGFSYAGMVDLSHKTFWTEDTFGYFTLENKYHYAWFYDDPNTKERIAVINKWEIHTNDSTPPKTMEYTKDGWIETTLKLREVHAILEKLQ